MKQQQSGFTLIELIVVIVILGILAATALPKFSDLTADARMAKMSGMAGSLRAAAAMAHGSSLAEGLYANSAVILEGNANVDMYSFYPSAVGTGIASAVDITGYVASAVNSSVIYFFPDTAHQAAVTCGISYVGAWNGGNNTSPLVSAPVIDTTMASTVASCA